MNRKSNSLDQFIDNNIPYDELSQEQRQAIALHGWSESMYAAALELKKAAKNEAHSSAPPWLEQKIMATFDQRPKKLQRTQKLKPRIAWTCIGALIGGLTVNYFKPTPPPVSTPATIPTVTPDTFWRTDTVYITKTVYRRIPLPPVKKDTINQALEYTMVPSNTAQNLFNQPEILHFLQVRTKLPNQ